MNYIKELKDLEYKKNFFEKELIMVNEQILYLKSKIQLECQHEKIIAYREYDGHKTNIDYYCKTCGKEFYINQIDKNKIEYH